MRMTESRKGGREKKVYEGEGWRRRFQRGLAQITGRTIPDQDGGQSEGDECRIDFVDRSTQVP